MPRTLNWSRLVQMVYLNVTVFVPAQKANQSTDIGRGTKGTGLSQPWHHCPPGVGCVWPWSMACAWFRMILEYASEWLHGWSGATLHGCWRAHYQSRYSTLLALTHNSDLFSLEPYKMQWIESFVVPMYSKGCDAEVFPSWSRSLSQHVKRALVMSFC